MKGNDLDKLAPKQKNLVDVPRSNAALEGDRYVELKDDLEHRKELLNQQGMKVAAAMHSIKQRVLTVIDGMGHKCTFTLTNTEEKLKFSKKGGI